MRVDTVRRVDRYAGAPICFTLTMLRKLARALGIEKMPGDLPKKILFIKLSEQGAMVLAYKAILRAVGMVGHENVYFCVFGANREILDVMAHFPAENVLTIRDSGFLPFVWDVLRVLARTRRLGIDTTVDLELFARVSAILAWLSGAQRRVGLHRFATEGLYRGDLLTHRVLYNPYLHVSTLCDVLVQALERDPGEIPLAKLKPEPELSSLPRFQPSEDEKQRIASLLSEHNVSLETALIIAIHPKAVDAFLPIRQWPTERFAALAQRIVSEYPEAVVVFTGLPEERETIEELCRELNPLRAMNLAGRLTLRELLTLYTLSAVLITTDGGPAHFAALTGADVIVLFGPETPLLYAPVGDRVHVRTAGLACSPCLSAANHRCSPCTDNQCMKAITVDDVYQKVCECIARRRP